MEDLVPPVPRGTLVGSAFGAAAGASLLATLPAALRLADAAGGKLFGAWIVLAACVFGPVLVLLLVFRGAREGARGLGGEAPHAAMAALFSFAIALYVIAMGVGAVLRAKTHHHGLAGATYALAILVAALGLALFATRLSRALGSLGPQTQRVLALASGLVLLVLVLLSCLRLAGEGERPWLGPLVIDVSGFVIATAFASRASFATLRSLARTGPIAALLLLVGGALVLKSAPSLTRLAHDHAKLCAPMLEGVTGRR